MTKVQVKAWINEKTDEKFRILVNNKYPKYEKGLLSYEIDMALSHWLAMHTQTQTFLDKNRPNPTPKVYSAFIEIKDYLLRKYYSELHSGQQIPKTHIENAIANIRGSDKRTIEKWFRTFHKNGLIKPVTSASWEIM